MAEFEDYQRQLFASKRAKQNGGAGEAWPAWPACSPHGNASNESDILAILRLQAKCATGCRMNQGTVRWNAFRSASFAFEPLRSV